MAQICMFHSIAYVASCVPWECWRFLFPLRKPFFSTLKWLLTVLYIDGISDRFLKHGSSEHYCAQAAHFFCQNQSSPVILFKWEIKCVKDRINACSTTIVVGLPLTFTIKTFYPLMMCTAARIRKLVWQCWGRWVATCISCSTRLDSLAPKTLAFPGPSWRLWPLKGWARTKSSWWFLCLLASRW